MSEFNLSKVQSRLRDFAKERDWEQFHTPKNLAMALSVESSELVEIFQWLTPEQASEIMKGPKAEAVRDEVSDIMTYLVRFCDVMDIDLAESFNEKMIKTEKKYPAEKVRGSMKKYNEY